MQNGRNNALNMAVDMTMMMKIKVMMIMVAHWWRLLRGDERTQRDTTLKLRAAHFAEIQNWARS